MILVTKRTSNYIKKSFVEGNRFFFHPYEWNRKENRPELTTSKPRLLIWCLNVLYTFSYFAFVVFRTVCMTTSEEASVTQKIYMTFVMAFFSFPAFFQLNILWSFKEFPQFVRDFIRYSSHFEGNRFLEASRSNLLPCADYTTNLVI